MQPEDSDPSLRDAARSGSSGPQRFSQPRVLAVAGSDSSGGAGIQADVKTLTVLGAYAATAVTAITVQSTHGVTEIMPIPASVVGAQMDAVLDDIGADVIKTGMLVNVDIVRAVALRARRLAPGVRLVLDPVLAASDGRELLARDAVTAFVDDLLPMASLVTPNVPEAELLTGVTIANLDDASLAADHLLAAGASAVLVKGGHLPGAKEAGEVTDLLRTADGEQHLFASSFLESRSTHGTGCTLASAIAAGIAEGLTLHDAVQRAHDYVHEAIRRAPALGQGKGPLLHAHPCLQR